MVKSVLLRVELSTGGSRFLRHWKREGEDSTSAGIVRYGYIAAVSLHDFSHDCEAQTRSLRFWSLAPPEPVENSFTVRQRHAGPMVGDADGAVRIDYHGDLAL